MPKAKPKLKPKPEPVRKKKGKRSLGSKILLILVLLTLSFLLGGFVRYRGDTLLKKADDLTGSSLLAPAHAGLIDGVRDLWSGLSISGPASGDSPKGEKPPPRKDPENEEKDPSESPQSPKVIIPDKLSDPMDTHLPEDNKDIEKLIEENEKKKKR